MMSNESSRPSITQADLQAGIDGGQFSLRYQPKLDFELLNLKGFEALARWEHPIYGQIMPSEFIPVAEETGLIGRLTELVVDQAFRWYKTTPGAQGHSLSINFSAKRLSNLDFSNWLYEICRRAAIRPDTVILEITEAGMMEQRLLAHDMFDRLRGRGFQIAIDDYGVGPSSKLLLQRLPINEIKIDTSFGIKATTSQEARDFIKATVDFGHSYKIKVAVGGVEDQDTLNYLRSIGVDYAYGFLISRPMTAEQSAEWILHRRQLTKNLLF